MQAKNKCIKKHVLGVSGIFMHGTKYFAICLHLIAVLTLAALCRYLQKAS